MDPIALSASVVPFIVVAARSLGERLWSRDPDVTARGAAGWGRRLARRVRDGDPWAAEAIDDVVADPENEAAHAALRRRLGETLSSSPELHAEISALIVQAQASAPTTFSSFERPT
ncbi:hypothetical protein [Actinoplanes sp. NPDC051851]|uniref:hypothetical protein n=1 Tax=Actinoplanes sp. NPDC051851 TaxID=3154753 RepID=UPI00343C566A